MEPYLDKKRHLSKEGLLSLYRWLILPRIANSIIRLEARGLIDGTSGIHGVCLTDLGEEAIAVGACLALEPWDWTALHHRGSGGYFARGLTLEEYFLQYFQKQNSLMAGFDGNMHMFDQKRHFVRFISDMAASAPSLNGVLSGLKYFKEVLKTDNEPAAVGLMFLGEGAASQDVVHASMNYAAVKKLPVVYVINNNQHAITPRNSEPESAAEYLASRAIGYGINDWFVIDGNDVLEVYYTTKKAVETARINSRPAIIECKTYRLGGHNDTEDMSYVDVREYNEWLGRDPVLRFRNQLTNMIDPVLIVEALKKGIPSHEFLPYLDGWDRGFLVKREAEKKDKFAIVPWIDEKDLKEIEANAHQEAWQAYRKAKIAPDPDIEALKTAKALPPAINQKEIIPSVGGASKKITFAKAIREALIQEMRRNPLIRVFGEDVAKTKQGVFKITEGLEDIFGPERIYNTPISESQIIGELIGQALVGLRPVGEIQFFPFVQTALSQTHNLAGTFYYHTGTGLPLVLRAAFGGGFSGGHFHSDCIEAYFYHQSGWKIVCPSNPYDAKGLMIAALRDNSPVLFMEQIWAYHRGSLARAVPEDEYLIPIGSAKIINEGQDITLAFYGPLMFNRVVLPAADDLSKKGVSVEIIDLRTVRPWDFDTLSQSVKKTGRLVIVHEARKSGGIGESIAYELSEKISDLKVRVVGSLDTPLPQHPILEAGRLPHKEEVVEQALSLLGVIK